MMKNKPDDRRDNVDKIQQNIGNTIENCHRANKVIEKTDDENYKKALEEKNDRRAESIDGMRLEIRDESINKKNGYK